jgi:hypothetical protein
MSANISVDNRIRYVAALIAAVTAVIYFMIGFNVVSVLDEATLASADQTFGIYAGVAYALGALLLVAVNRRMIWALGAVLQIFVIYTYFDLASQRTPAFEIWGIVLRIAQAIILVILVYLAIRMPEPQPLGPRPSREEWPLV